MTSRTPRLGALGLGTAPLGGLFTAVADEDAAAVVQAAWDAGVRYYDTAPYYGLGLSERRVGALLAGLPRDELVVSTKVGRLIRPAGTPAPADGGLWAETDDVVPVRDYSADGVRRSLEESLGRLGMDRVDVVYVHDCDDPAVEDQVVSETVPALVALREQGVVDAVGIGMGAAAPMARFLHRCDLDVVMVAGRTTLLDQGALDEVLPAALERGVDVVAAAVYGSGVLARPRPVAGTTVDYAPAPPEVLARVDRIADVCERHGVTLPEAALAFPLRHPAVVSVVVGCRTAEEVRAAVDRSACQVPEELWDELRAEGLLRPDAP